MSTQASTQSSAPAAVVEATPAAAPAAYGEDQVALLRRTVAAGLGEAEFALFLEIARRSGLDPFQRQIYAVKRGGRMVVQTGIDGYFALAERSGAYAGVDDLRFVPEEGPHPQRATATVYRLVQGHRAAFTYTARWDEYVQRDSSGAPAGMWRTMPFSMLGKCALARALRSAFPAQLGGLYTEDEMQQADSVVESQPANHTQKRGPRGAARATWERLEARALAVGVIASAEEWASLVGEITGDDTPRPLSDADYDRVVSYCRAAAAQGQPEEAMR